jgi:hypothetical protein
MLDVLALQLAESPDIESDETEPKSTISVNCRPDYR